MKELIQLIASIKAIRQNPKISIHGVYASISSTSIVEILNLSTLGRYKRLGSRDTRDLVSKKFDLFELQFGKYGSNP